MKTNCILVNQLFYLDLIVHFSIDYMHAICLNIFKHFLIYWFTNKYSSYSFSLFRHLKDIEKHYLNLKFPYFKSRPPRKLEDFDNWKAIELRLYFLIF